MADLVWPEIRRLAENIIQNVQSQSVIIIEAAVLLEAGWSVNSCYHFFNCTPALGPP